MASNNSGSRPSSGRPSSGRSSSNRSSSGGSGRPSSGRPSSGAGERSYGSRPSTGSGYGRSSRPDGERSRYSDDRPASGRPSSRGGSSDRPRSDRPRSDRPRTERSGSGERSYGSRDSRGGSSDRPRTERSGSGERSYGSRDGSSDRPRSDRPRTERSGSGERSYGSRDSRGGSDRPTRSYSDRDSRDSRGGSDRPTRSYSDRDSRGGSSDRPRSDRPRRENPYAGDRPQASEDRRPSTRGGRPDRPSREGRGGGRYDERGGRPDRAGGRYSDRDDRAPRAPRGEKRVNVQDPIIPDHITGNELPRAVRNELRTLPDGLALRVARHLVASGEMMDINPELAWEHAKAALNKASRVGIVREAAAEAAYHAGHFAEALTEFRAARRMRGIKEYWPLMADCERALGRPKKAIDMAGDPIVATLDRASRVEMRIVAAGARSDLGQWEAALATLQCPELSTATLEPWAARIRYAYADVLANMGHNDEAIEWFHRAAAVDMEQATDADARIKELEGSGYDVFEGQDQVLEYEDLEDEELDD